MRDRGKGNTRAAPGQAVRQRLSAWSSRLGVHPTLVGELVRYENSYRLCYPRGPEGSIIVLAEKIG